MDSVGDKLLWSVLFQLRQLLRKTDDCSCCPKCCVVQIVCFVLLLFKKGCADLTQCCVFFQTPQGNADTLLDLTLGGGLGATGGGPARDPWGATAQQPQPQIRGAAAAGGVGDAGSNDPWTPPSYTSQPPPAQPTPPKADPWGAPVSQPGDFTMKLFSK